LKRLDTNCTQVNDGYFVHFFAPADLPPLRKHVIFVLDVSGSMNGRKIEQLKEAMATILGNLKQGDLFSIVIFSTTVQVRKYQLQPIHETQSYKARADIWQTLFQISGMGSCPDRGPNAR
jgi:uncharacterized protein with von Willebrand factor type A (vWA) domain